MSRAYSRIVRSEENFPIRATFRTAFLVQPARVLATASRDPLLRRGVGVEVGEVEVGVVVLDDVLEEPREDPRLERREEGRAESVEDPPHPRVVVVDLPGRVRAGVLHPLELVGGVAEDEDVLRAHLLHDLDVRAVERPDRQRAVHRELHVARCPKPPFRRSRSARERSAAGMIRSASETR